MKIPDQAQKVFEGVIFDVYQWEQKMFDGSKATFEALRRTGTVQVIPLVDDKIVLAQEEQPMAKKKWSFVGGRQELGEEPIETAKRELMEETGLACDDWTLFKRYEAEGKLDWTKYIYVARGCKKVKEPELDPGEKIVLSEVSFEDFVSIVSDRDFWGQDVANDLFRIIHEGGLGGYRDAIFGTK